MGGGGGAYDVPLDDLCNVTVSFGFSMREYSLCNKLIEILKIHLCKLFFSQNHFFGHKRPSNSKCSVSMGMKLGINMQSEAMVVITDQNFDISVKKKVFEFLCEKIEAKLTKTLNVL